MLFVAFVDSTKIEKLQNLDTKRAEKYRADLAEMMQANKARSSEDPPSPLSPPPASVYEAVVNAASAHGLSVDDVVNHALGRIFQTTRPIEALDGAVSLLPADVRPLLETLDWPAPAPPVETSSQGPPSSPDREADTVKENLPSVPPTPVAVS